MKWKLFFSSLVVALVFIGCSNAGRSNIEIKREYPEFFKIFIENAAALDRNDEVVVLDVAEIKTNHPRFNDDTDYR